MYISALRHFPQLVTNPYQSERGSKSLRRAPHVRSNSEARLKVPAGNFFDEGRVLQVATAYEAASGIRNQLAELQARSLGARDRTEPWRSCEPG